jgi:hypothetical protein
MQERYVLVNDPLAPAVCAFIDRYQLVYEPHLRRIRFWIPSSGPVLTEFLLCYAVACPPMEDYLL